MVSLVFSMALNPACLPGRQHNQHHAQRAVLARFLNGDPVSSDVMIYNPNVHIIDEPVRARMLQDIEAFVLAALVPTTCPLFSRSRWNGADGALAWLGLFSAHYNGSLLKHTIQKFAGLPLLQGPGGREEDHWIRAIGAELSQQGSQHAIEQGNVQAAHAAEAVDEEMDKEGSEQDDWHKRNKQYRRRSVNFVQDLCLGAIFVFSIVAGLLQNLRRELFHRASVVWRRNVYARGLRSQGRSNVCKLLEVLASEDVKRFYTGLWSSLRQSFTLLRPHNTFEIRALLFTSLARAGACVHQLLVTRRAGYPLELFKLLTNDSTEMVEKILRSSPCLRDELSHEFLSRFGTPAELGSAPAKSILHCIAARREYDICCIECRHASSRRVQKTSAQTWVRSLESVSAAFVIKQNKLARQNVAGVQAHAAPSQGAASEPEPEAKRKAKRSRSAWAAFMHENTQGRTNKKWGDGMADLSRRIREISDSERERLEDLAKTATAAAFQKQGSGPAGFAQTRQQKETARRLQLRMAQDAEDSAAAPASRGMLADASTSPLDSMVLGLPEELARLSQENLDSVAMARRTAQEEERTLQAYMQENAPPALALLPDVDFTQSNSITLPESLPTAEFSPPLAAMAEAG